MTATKVRSRKCCVWLGVFALSMAGSAGATDIGGLICSDTTWRLTDSPFVVKNSAVVGGSLCQGAMPTLTIEPGVEIRFDQNKYVDVYGTLIARGTQENPILFTSSQTRPAPGDWDGIRFEDSADDASFDAGGNYIDGSIMEFCTVEFAKDSSGGKGVVALISAAPFLHEVTVRNSGLPTNSPVIGINSPVSVRMSGVKVLSSTGSAGIALSLSQPDSFADVADPVVDQNTGSGMSLSGNNITVSGATVSGNAGYGISATGNNVVITGATVSQNAQFGIEVAGTVVVRDSILSSNSGDGIDVAGGDGTLENCLIEYNVGHGIGLLSHGCGLSFGSSVPLEASPNAAVNWTIQDNLIFSNQGAGIAITHDCIGFSRAVMIRANCIARNAGGGASAPGLDFDNQSGYAPGASITIEANTIAAHAEDAGDGTAVRIGGSTTADLTENNLTRNGGFTLSYVRMTGSPDLDAEGNWWGVTDSNAIADSILDCFDNGAYACVDYSQFAAGPIDAAPDIDACAAGTLLLPTSTPTPTSTETPTITPTPTSTVTATATPTLTPAPCVGDCDGGGAVTVNEIITMVNIALGSTPVSACTAGDADGDGKITINEIIAAVNNALNGCAA